MSTTYPDIRSDRPDHAVRAERGESTGTVLYWLCGRHTMLRDGAGRARRDIGWMPCSHRTRAQAVACHRGED